MKNTVSTFQKMKENGETLLMLTAYDYSTAKLFDEAGIHSILVGDSLGMVMLGHTHDSGDCGGYDPPRRCSCEGSKECACCSGYAVYVLPRRLYTMRWSMPEGS